MSTSCYWMPLSLLGLHRYLRTRRPVWLLVFAASWLQQVLCKGYSFFYFSAMLLLWVLWFAPPWRERRAAAGIGAAWTLAALPLVPVFLEYRAIHERYDLRRALFEIEAFSADLASVLDGSPVLAHWRSLFGGEQETWLFPGIAPVLLAAVAALVGLRQRRPEPPARSTVRVFLAAVAAMAALVALSAVAVGPWQAELGPLKLSVTAAHKPLGLAWLFLLAVAATSPRFVAAYRRRSAFVFYAAATLAMWLLSLGPSPRAFGTWMWDKAPYWWLLKLPGFSSLRVPARFWICAVLCLTVAAAIGLSFLAGRMRRGRRALLVAAGLVVLWDGWIEALPLVPLPERSALLEEIDVGTAPILELPMSGYLDAVALYRATFHRRPLVNGFSGHEPPHHIALRLSLERGDGSVLAALTEQEPLAVVINRHRDPGSSWERWFEGHPDARRVGSNESEIAYLLPRAPSVGVASSPAADRPLAIQGLRVNVDPDGAPRMIDRDRRTRWRTIRPSAAERRSWWTSGRSSASRGSSCRSGRSSGSFRGTCGSKSLPNPRNGRRLGEGRRRARRCPPPSPIHGRSR